MKLLKNERIAHCFSCPRRILTTQYNGINIKVDHRNYSFMSDGRLNPESEILGINIKFSVGGVPAVYQWSGSRDTESFDGWLIYGNIKEKVSCRNVTPAMAGYDDRGVKKRGLNFHKAIKTGGGRGKSSSSEKNQDIKAVEWHMFSDIRDSDCWVFYLIESELILAHIETIWQETYKYKWSAEEFEDFVSKQGYVRQKQPCKTAV